MKPTNFPGRTKTKQKEAGERAAERAERTPAEQLSVLDRRFGVGLGAVRERARLAKLAG